MLARSPRCRPLGTVDDDRRRRRHRLLDRRRLTGDVRVIDRRRHVGSVRNGRQPWRSERWPFAPQR